MPTLKAQTRAGANVCKMARFFAVEKDNRLGTVTLPAHILGGFVFVFDRPSSQSWMRITTIEVTRKRRATCVHFLRHFVLTKVAGGARGLLPYANPAAICDVACLLFHEKLHCLVFLGGECNVFPFLFGRCLRALGTIELIHSIFMIWF